MLPFQDHTQPIKDRVQDLISRLTIEEKVSQMLHDSPAINRPDDGLNIPKYNWWNECLHGVARAGIATVFPQAIGLSATFNPDLIKEVATAISDEARAKHHHNKQGDQYHGLTYWTPNINIVRDPRWGRAQETYGEDPYLTSRIAVAFVQGLQGDDPTHLKLIATPKHFAVHSGPEGLRHSFDAIVDDYDLWDTYLPAFEATVKEAQAGSIMGAYNRTNGEACCASPTLLQKILRDQWGFDGYVVSDCGGITDIYRDHKLVDTPAEAAALAVKNGCELNCGETYRFLLSALEQNLLTEADIDLALTRLFTARFRLGMFDPESAVSYSKISMDCVNSEKHRALALKTAVQSCVLLKNDNILPLNPKNPPKIAVLGPNADNPDTLLGNYYGTPQNTVTFLDGIRAYARDATYARGCHISQPDWDGTDAALSLARAADIIIFCGGLNQTLEGEEGNVIGEQSRDGDRIGLRLPQAQLDLLKSLHALGKPLVLVLANGSPVSLPWAKDHIPAILEAWYPGEVGGTAVADILFGRENPSGRLPVTIYNSVDDLPHFENYAMEGRTYRYFRGTPQFSFGHGLSYTQFRYTNLQADTPTPPTLQEGGTIDLYLTVSNTGQYDGEEVVQLYFSHDAPQRKPIRQLVAFQRVFVQAGRSQTIKFTLTSDQLHLVNEDGNHIFVGGKVNLSTGNNSTPLPITLIPQMTL